MTDHESDSKARIARNEAIFRAVNERVDEMKDDQAEMRDFLCECGNLDCTEGIPMTDDEYERVRSQATTFAVAPGHVLENVESVVEKTDRFFIVEKDAGEKAIAAATDPRR